MWKHLLDHFHILSAEVGVNSWIIIMHSNVVRCSSDYFTMSLMRHLGAHPYRMGHRPQQGVLDVDL